MKWLIRLYPREWRDRYEEEFAAVLEERGLSILDALDIVLCTFTTRRQLRAQPTSAEDRRTGMAGSVAQSALAVVVAISVLLSFGHPQATGPFVRAPLTLTRTLPLDPAAVAAPAKGCLWIMYNSPIVDARTGAVEAHGLVTSLACDKTSAPTEKDSRQIFENMSTPTDRSWGTRDTGSISGRS
jgi:hypothetical protein